MGFASAVCSRSPGAARRTVVTLLSLAVTIVMLDAQPPATPARPDTEAPTFRLGIDLITVDVVVTDRDRQPVRTLTVDDFQVYEDGVLQPIVTFSYVDTTVHAPEADAASATPVADVASNLPRGTDGRVYLILLDDLHTHALRSDTVQAIARQFIEHHLTVNDLAAVAVTSGRTSASHPFTRTRQPLLDAVDQFVGEYRPPPQRASRRDPGRTVFDVQRPFDGTDQRRNAQTMLRSLGTLAEWMAGFSDRRKVILLISQGVEDSLSEGFLAEMRPVVSAAARHHIAVYPIDPRGLPTGEPSEIPTRALVDEAPFSVAARRAKGSLRRLAEQTGGVAFTDSNQFRGALERIVRENSAYFLLGYRAPRETPDGKEHQIRIEVDRPGVRVRARRSYVADSEPVVQRPF